MNKLYVNQLLLKLKTQNFEMKYGFTFSSDNITDMVRKHTFSTKTKICNRIYP